MNLVQKLHDPSLGKKRYRVWIAQAEFDMQASRISFEKEFYEWSAYQAQQAVEKSLKAVIVYAGVIPPKVHKLSILMGLCNKLNPSFRNTHFNFSYIDAFTFISRYPFLLPGKDATPHDQIKREDAKIVLDEAKIFIDNIKFILKYGESVKGELSKAYEAKYNIEERLTRVTLALVQEFDPERIILFGSYARDITLKEETTIDLLLIANTTLDFISRIQRAREISRGGLPAIEPLIYTPEEYKLMTEEEGEGFLETAVDSGVVLYDKVRGIDKYNVRERSGR